MSTVEFGEPRQRGPQPFGDLAAARVARAPAFTDAKAYSLTENALPHLAD